MSMECDELGQDATVDLGSNPASDGVCLAISLLLNCSGNIQNQHSPFHSLPLVCSQHFTLKEIEWMRRG